MNHLALVWLFGATLALPAANGTEAEIRYRSGAAEIAATLLLPEGPGPHPVAVFLHGSGPHTRADQRPYAELLLDAGVGALVADKRGSGESTGDWQRSSLEDLARDAVNGIAAVRARADVDPDCIGLFGGSQAGWVAPLASTLDDDIAFFIVLSGGGITPQENERWAYDRALDDAGATGAERERARALLDRYFEYLASGEGLPELESAIDAYQEESWYGALNLRRVLPSPESREAWAWVATYDPMPRVRSMTAPTLLLFGGRDHVQPAERAAERWRESFARAGHERFEIRFFPEANHMLRIGGEDGHGGEGGHGALAPFVPELAPVLAEWLETHGLASRR